MSKDRSHEIAQLKQLSESKAFLGQEFLTWLWFLIEETGGEIQLESSGQQFELWIDNKLSLESFGTHVSKQLLRGAQPSSSLEATAALLNGKYATELSFGMQLNDVEYNFTLNSKSLTPSGIRFPGHKKADDEDILDSTTNRIRFTEHLLDTIDHLFIQFIDTRTNKSWEQKETDSIREWIHGRSPVNGNLH